MHGRMTNVVQIRSQQPTAFLAFYFYNVKFHEMFVFLQARQKAEEEAAAAAAAEAAAAEAAAANEVEEADLPPPPTEIPDEMIPASPTGSHVSTCSHRTNPLYTKLQF